MTDELKPCLAHPCDGAMKANLYDASLTCSKCQFQVADESEYSALVAGRQTAIDAALTELVEYLDRHETTIYESVSDWAVEVVRSRIGTNPLAERDARIAELESLLAEAYADADDVLRPRIEELEHMLESERKRNALLKFANSLFANSGDNDELAIDQLRRELAEARKDAERYRWAVENAIIETSNFKHDGRDPASTKLPLDNAIDAAMRQEGE